MKYILIILTLIFLSSHLFGQSDADDNDKNIRYNITSGFLWKSISKGKIQSKNVGYVGSYKSGVPHGKGTMTYYDGRKIEANLSAMHGILHFMIKTERYLENL